MPGFVPPPVQVGDLIMFSPNPDASRARMWYPAMVSMAGDTTLDCITWIQRGSGVQFRVGDGVRHTTDPILLDPHRISAMIEDGTTGVWEYAPQTIRLNKLATDNVRMQADIEELRKMIASASNGKVNKAPAKKRGRPKKSVKAKLVTVEG